MREYQFKESFKRLTKSPDKIRLYKLSAALQKSNSLLLAYQKINNYERVDPANAKLRYLIQDYLDKQQAWRLLWIPPSLPYYQTGGVFVGCDKLTKRLIFSSWRVVPKVIAALSSYEVERRIIRTDKNPPKSYKRDTSYGSLIDFNLDSSGQYARPTAMNAMSLMYPSVTLAAECDPMRLTSLSSGETAIAEMQQRIQRLITETELREHYENDATAREDESWYWAAPLLLDKILHTEITDAWFSQENLSQRWRLEETDEDSKGWQKHVEAMRLLYEQPDLGRMPANLSEVLAWIALASPAVCGLRAINRLVQSSYTLATMSAAGHIAWSMRTLFNTVEATAVIRGQYGEPFWQSVLRYSINGNLQAVLDEYAHILRDALGLFDCDDERLAHDIAIKMGHALSVRAVTLYMDEIKTVSTITIDDGRGQNIRTHFAMSLLEDGQDRVNANGQSHQANLRDAFNSPFWPFILVSTSIGQEGLDFHPYCHAVVHWNLPSNPVDLEQREGRVHRFKGHAVRRNLARQYGNRVGNTTKRDIWEAMFTLAASEKVESTDLIPYWILPPNGTTTEYAYIERYVPIVTLSREKQKLAHLQNMVAHYRMVFGQVRQEDMLEMLIQHSSQLTANDMGKFQINLSPKG